MTELLLVILLTIICGVEAFIIIKQRYEVRVFQYQHDTKHEELQRLKDENEELKVAVINGRKQTADGIKYASSFGTAYAMTGNYPTASTALPTSVKFGTQYEDF